MKVAYSDCEKCVHLKVCKNSETYGNLIGLTKNINDAHAGIFPDADFLTRVECLHFNKTEPVFR